MIEVRKNLITNGTNNTVKFISRFKPVASFFGVPEFYVSSVEEYLENRRRLEGGDSIEFRFLDINGKNNDKYLLGDSTGEFEARIPITFADRGLADMFGVEDPDEILKRIENRKLTIYNPLVMKDDKKGDWVNGFGISPVKSVIYHGSDREYLNTARPILLG